MVLLMTVVIYAIFGLVRLYMTSYAALMTTTFLASLSFPPMLELTLIISKYRASPSGACGRTPYWFGSVGLCRGGCQVLRGCLQVSLMRLEPEGADGCDF